MPPPAWPGGGYCNVIAFLCSPASEMIYCRTILIDGGWATTKYLSETGLKSDWMMPEDAA